VASRACLLLAHSQLGEQLRVTAASLVLHLHVRVERHERSVRQAPQRVDLGQGHVVVHEHARQTREDRHEAVERRARDARGGDHLLGLEVAERQDVGEVPAPHRLGLLLGHLLDVDAANGGEDHHRALARAVPHHARVVLLLHLRLGVHQHAARALAADLEHEDLARVRFRLRRRVRELDPTGLHAPTRQHLRLDHGRAGDPLRDRAGLVRVGREAVVGHGDAGTLDDLPRLVLEEAHAARKPIRPMAAA